MNRLVCFVAVLICFVIGQASSQAESIPLRNAEQSTTNAFRSSCKPNKCIASSAIDGDMSTFSRTTYSKDSTEWWSAELAQTTLIEAIYVYTDIELIEADVFRQFSVETGMTRNDSHWTVCKDQLNPTETPIIVHCRTPTTAKYIRLVNIGDSLAMSEVIVNGTAKTGGNSSVAPTNNTSTPGGNSSIASTNNTSTPDAVSIVCAETQVTATVDETKLTNLTITKISIKDCAEESYNVSGHTVTVSFDTCAHNITQSSNIITQETHMRVSVCKNDPTNTICRGSFLTYQLKCRFDRRLNVSTAEGVNVTEKKSLVVDKEGKTNFTAQMKFYTSDLYSTPAASPLQVTAFQPLYVSVEALENQLLFKFIVEECYATSSGDPFDRSNYLFFSEKCPMDNTFKEYVARRSDTKYCYKVDAFRFIAVKAQVFFHCRLLICKRSSTGPDCTQRCTSGTRRRRAIKDGGIEEIYINSGPVVFKKKPTCETRTCPTNSRCYDLRPTICRCTANFVLDRTTNTCKKVGDNVFKANNLHLDQQFLLPYGIATSDEFIRLATHIENQLMTAYLMDRKFIQGVKVVSARSGSIIVDIIVLHSSAMTSLEAFNYFLKNVLIENSDSRRLNIIHQMTPLMDGYHSGSAKTGVSLDVIVAAAVAVIAIAATAVAVAFVIRGRNRSGKNKVIVQDNDAISIS